MGMRHLPESLAGRVRRRVARSDVTATLTVGHDRQAGWRHTRGTSSLRAGVPLRARAIRSWLALEGVVLIHGWLVQDGGLVGWERREAILAA